MVGDQALAGYRPADRHRGVAESSIFAVIALLIGSLGATVVAGHQIALNFSSLVFMIPYSSAWLSRCAVGQALGRRAARSTLRRRGRHGTALAYACLSASMMLLLREHIASIYTADPTVIQSRGDADCVLGAVPVFRCDPGHGGRCAARLSGHPGNDDPDAVRIGALGCRWVTPLA
jgi:hypothetical protein